MICPFCAEPVADGATVCKTCRRDISVPRPVMEANQKLEQRVRELEAELAELRRLAAQAPATPVAEVERPPIGARDLFLYLVLPVGLILLAHYLLVVKFDARLLWLRAVSIVLPALFGYGLETARSPRWYVFAVLGVVAAVAAVLGMSTVVYLVDGDPILPTSAVTWRETLEYTASIALSYMLGGLIASGLHPALSARLRSRNPLVQLASVLAVPEKGKAGGGIEQRVERMVKLMNLGISAATAAGAIYTGFKGVL